MAAGSMTTVTDEQLKALVDGKISWAEAKELIHRWPKDADRFFRILDILQARVLWQDRILLRISEHVFVVQKGEGQRIAKCECGYEFGDYRRNWKLECLIYTRRTKAEFDEIYKAWNMSPRPDLVEIREFYCPQCATQLATETVPAGLPVIFEVLPDIDGLYRDVLHRPLGDEDEEWYQNRTAELTAEWAKNR